MKATPFLILLLLTGCHWPGLPMKPKHPQYGRSTFKDSLSVPQRDTNWFNANQPKALPQRMTLATLPEPDKDIPEIGFVPSHFENPPRSQLLHFIFTPPREYDGFNLYGGTNTDRSDWRFLLSTNRSPIQLLATNSCGYFGLRAFLRNGIDGRQTESDWATR